MPAPAPPAPPAPRVHLEPLGLVGGEPARELVAAGVALPLAGGPLAFTAARVTLRGAHPGAQSSATLPLAALDAWASVHGPPVMAALAARRRALVAPRTALVGLPAGQPLLMGIVNATPDSFSDGGEHLDPGSAIAHGRALAASGAAIIDVGGESTRPGAMPVPVDEELRRVVPVVAGLAADPAALAGARISIDTRRAAVMRAALDAGAHILNDVSGLTHDPDAMAVAAETDAPVVLMHMPLPPGLMSRTPAYADVLAEVAEHLEERIDACVAAGIARRRLMVDPGIGFAKRGPQNLAVLRGLGLLHELGCPILVGISRKGLGDPLLADLPPRAHLPASLAGAFQALEQGATILRVHDVAQTSQVLRFWRRLRDPLLA